MRKRTHITIISALLVVAAVVVASAVAYAQTITPGVTLYAIPPTASPNESVTIGATGFSFNEDAARFDWVINGTPRPELSGVGKKSITATAGKVGEDINVRVRITDTSGAIITQEITVPVAGLSLVSFAETYVPKWYKGRALATPGSTVTIVAVPEFDLDRGIIKPENLLYSWSVDTREDVQKGVGVQAMRLQLAAVGRKEYRVRVKVEDPAKTIKKEGALIIRPSSPRAVLYAHTPLGGIEFRNALSSLASARRGLFDFAVEPFFFSVAAKNALSYVWSVANEPSDGNPQNPNLLTIDVEPQSTGEAAVAVTVRDPRNEFLSAASDFLRLILQ